jgi:hypothetical protein
MKKKTSKKIIPFPADQTEEPVRTINLTATHETREIRVPVITGKVLPEPARTVPVIRKEVPLNRRCALT